MGQNEDTVRKAVLKFADKKLDEIADYAFSRSQEFHVRNGNVDTGFLLRSGNINRKFMEKEIVYSAPYSAFIEFGTRPHKMNGFMLVDWVHRKLGLQGKAAEGAAWAIARKISKKGTKPYPFVRPAIEETAAKVRSGWFNETIQL